MFGPLEPPQNQMIFNRRLPTGKFRPLSEFFEPESLVVRTLRSRREQVIGELKVTEPCTEKAEVLCHELAEIDIELEKVNG